MSSSFFRPDGSVPSGVDRYLDDDLSPEERAELVARLAGDAELRRSFVAELRLALALGAALDDTATDRSARADLLMATLSESRSTRALRNLEQAIGLGQREAAARRPWLPWLPVAAAALLALALLWHGHPGTPAAPVRPAPPADHSPAIDQPAIVQAPAGAPTGTHAPVAEVADRRPPAEHVTAQGPQTAPVSTDAGPASPPVAIAEIHPAPDAAPSDAAADAPIVSAPRPRPLHATKITTGDGEAPLRPPGADTWVGGPCIIHRHGTRTVARGASATVMVGDVIDAGDGGSCELRLGGDLALTCSPLTRVLVPMPRPNVPGRRLVLVWGELAVNATASIPALVSTEHGEVRCDSGRTLLHVHPDWLCVTSDGGRARVGSDTDRKTIDDGQYALLVHGRSVIAPAARSASAVLAGILTVHGEALLPCIMRLAGAPPASSRADRLHALADAGFTAVAMRASSIDNLLLSEARAAGVGIIGEVATDSGSTEALSSVRADPALLGWWMEGLPGELQPRDAVRIASAVRRLDPLHVLAASFIGDQGRSAPPACDLLVLEHSADDSPAVMATRWAGPAAIAALHAKTVLAAVPLLAPDHNRALGPSILVRQRCLAYLALLSGARGLVWNNRGMSANDASAWDEAVAGAGALAAELSRIAPQVLSNARQRVPLAAGVLPGIRWDNAGRCVVLLVNPSDRSCAIAAPLPGVAPVAAHLLVEDDAGDMRLAGGRLSGTLPPYGVAVLVGELPYTP